MTSYSHELGDNGNTEAIVVGYSKHDGYDSFTANTRIGKDEVEGDINEMSKVTIDPIARRKVYEWFRIEESLDEEE